MAGTATDFCCALEGEMAATAGARAPKDIQGNCFKFIFGDFLGRRDTAGPGEAALGPAHEFTSLGLAGRMLAAAVPRGCSAIRAAIGYPKKKGLQGRPIQRKALWFLQAYMPA